MLHNPHQQYQGQRQDRLQRQHPNTEGLTDTAMKSMYNFSVMIPAILFLSVFLLFRIKYSLGKTEIDALQVEKGKLMEKVGTQSKSFYRQKEYDE